MAAEEARKAIHMAVKEGDVEGVARMLDEDPRLLSSEWLGCTLITQAAIWDHVSLVRLLLERGAEVDRGNTFGNTALHVAAQRGHEEMVSILLTNGALVSRKGYLRKTALMYASEWGHAGVVQLLLRYMGGHGLDETNEHGCTAIWFACLRGDPDIVRTLLLARADHSIADIDGQTPQQIAQARRRHQCVNLIQVSRPFINTLYHAR